MTEREYTIRDIADAAQVSQQAAHKRSIREAWPYTEATGRGGKRRLYQLAHLPADIQKSLILIEARKAKLPSANQAADKPAANGYDRDSLWDRYSRKPEKQKAKAKHHLQLMHQVETLVEAGHSRQDAVQTVAAVDGSIAWSRLRDIYHGKPGRPGLKHYDRTDWLAALVPGHVGRTAKAEISPEAWEFFKADYLRSDKPNLTTCYERLKKAAEANDWQVPSCKTVERRIKELPLTVRVLLREGEHALLQLFPALERSVRDLHALEWINGDGYQHNVFVRWPDGTIGRPKTWFWQDVYSRRLLTWRTDETEHSDMIRLSFGDLVERFGIPEHATIDNTRAAANKWMTGGVPNRYRFKVREDDPLGLFPMLGVTVHWTSVQAGKGHGQAKPVERAFGVGGLGEYVDKHPLLAGAYTGPNPMAKPENYGSRAVPIDVFLKCLEDGVNTWNAIAKRDTEICARQRSFDEAFEESYCRSAIRKATAEQRRLWMLTAEAVKVQQDGTVVLEAGGASGIGRNRFGSDALFEYIGQKIVVRFDPDKLHGAVYAYTLDGRLIGEAQCIQAAGFGDTTRGREHNRAKKQKARAAKEMAAAEQRMTAIEAAERYLPTTEPPAAPKAGAARVDFRRKQAASAAPAASAESTDPMIDEGDNLILSLREHWKGGGTL